VRQFEPDLVIVSAGFDAHEHDPLGGMRVTTPAFAAMTRELRAVADDCCRGRLVAVVEGGYDLQALGTSLDGSIDALAGDVQPAAWPSSGIRSSRGEEAVAATSAAIRGFWNV
jgi:acetoin utilization deacetylase AcuC-like enzyme